METILLKHTFTRWLQTYIKKNDRIVSENNKIAEAFNTHFESVTDSLNRFEWIGESVNINDEVEQITAKF